MRLATNRYREGYSPYLEQLDAQRGLLGAQLSLIQLRSDALSALGVDRLPYSIKVLLENLLRHEDGVKVSAADIEALARYDGHSQIGRASCRERVSNCV